MFVHDSSLFVTVQLLEETPAVLSLGNLCEDHGCSYESVSGQKPRLTKDGKSIICKTGNFVPLVVPGLSANAGSVSSSTSPPQDSSRREVETATGSRERSASSSSSGPVLERSDEMAPGTRFYHSKNHQNKNKKRMTGKNRTLRQEIFLEWLEEFKENLVDTELHASARSSQESYSEHPTKVATKSRKHSFLYSLPKRPELRRLLENQK